MDCSHELDRDTCSICIHGRFYDPWHTNPRIDYAAHLTDGMSGSLAPPRGGTNNPAPSEALYREALADSSRRREEECLACMCIEDEDPSLPYYDDHTCNAPELIWRRRTTQWLPTAGRPSWCRVEFHRDAFLGFYRSDLSAVVGFGYDPTFSLVWEENK